MKRVQSRQDGGRRMIWTIPLALVMIVGTGTVAFSALKTVLPDDRSAASTSMTASAGHGSTSASAPTAALRDFLAETRSQAPAVQAPAVTAAKPVQVATAAAIVGHNGQTPAQQIKALSATGDKPLVSADRDITDVRPMVRPVSYTEAEQVTIRQRLERLWSAGIFR